MFAELARQVEHNQCLQLAKFAKVCVRELYFKFVRRKASKSKMQTIELYPCFCGSWIKANLKPSVSVVLEGRVGFVRDRYPALKAWNPYKCQSGKSRLCLEQAVEKEILVFCLAVYERKEVVTSVARGIDTKYR